MRRVLTYEHPCSVLLFLFTLVLALNTVQSTGARVPGPALLAPDAVTLAHGPIMPPDPWDTLMVAHGPIMPPDPWDTLA